MIIEKRERRNAGQYFTINIKFVHIYLHVHGQRSKSDADKN